MENKIKFEKFNKKYLQLRKFHLPVKIAYKLAYKAIA